MDHIHVPYRAAQPMVFFTTAVFNVYEEAKRQSKDAERIHPLALWDFHLLREIDDSGYIDNLYKNHPAAAAAAGAPG